MFSLDSIQSNSIFANLPDEAREWAEKLHWNERRYVLSLCHILCASPSETQAEFLDEYTADGLVSRLLEDLDTYHKVKRHLEQFRIETELTESLLRAYIRQFYIHCAQDMHRQPEQYLEVAVRLMGNSEESNNAFNYTLGFELLKMLFVMSWMQQERLYRLQRNQEEFLNRYIKPIRFTHQLNGIVIPKDKKKFFAKRDYYIQIPKISKKKLQELVMATFTADTVTEFGFAIIRHPNHLQFDFDYVYTTESEDILGN
ncbi:MAG: cobyrinic acid a,c-diamide synthase [Cyanobacteria bacterium SID2]|nr:cobyrinic acid a,c-diamide synthase [Cyanobacteria bacterium SID2]MBP0005743.1 cobyrinic acid a,c-diamide synthase [Cyanobacteria bacterium SBC]